MKIIKVTDLMWSKNKNEYELNWKGYRLVCVDGFGFGFSVYVYKGQELHYRSAMNNPFKKEMNEAMMEAFTAAMQLYIIELERQLNK